ncbi:hypothetical protein LG325_10460 [Marinobacter nauticus]
MTQKSPDTNPIEAPQVAAWWAERRRYLEQIRKVPDIKQRFRKELFFYVLRRVLWSYGFFPVVLAFWLPLVLASFNPVVMAQDLITLLQGFVATNPEQQANTLSSLTIGWLSIGTFFLVFDVVISPFRSPYEYEADVYMKSWEQLNGTFGSEFPAPSPE